MSKQAEAPKVLDFDRVDEILAGIRYRITQRTPSEYVLWHDDEPIAVGAPDDIEWKFAAALTSEQREALRIEDEASAAIRAEERAERHLSCAGFEPECLYD